MKNKIIRFIKSFSIDGNFRQSDLENTINTTPFYTGNNCDVLQCCISYNKYGGYCVLFHHAIARLHK